MELIAVLAIAGLVSSMATAAMGLGGGLLVVPVMTLMFPPKEVIAATAPMFFANAVMTGWIYRDQPLSRRGYLAIPGVLLGIWVGSHFLGEWSTQHLRLAIGVLVLGLLALRERHGVRKVLPLWSGVPLSLVSGIASALSNIGATVLSYYLFEPDTTPSQLVATLTMLSIVMAGIKLVVFARLGLLGWHDFVVAGPSVVTIALGARIGRNLHQKMSGSTFRALMAGVIAISGTALIFQSVL